MANIDRVLLTRGQEEQSTFPFRSMLHKGSHHQLFFSPPKTRVSGLPSVSPGFVQNVIYHEHFGLTAKSLQKFLESPFKPLCFECLETFLDTPDGKLLEQNRWLRCSENLRDHAITWTLKEEPVRQNDGLAYVEHIGVENVMKALATLLGEKNNAISPVSYCRRPFATIRTRRYTFPGTQSFKWWLDVCYFEKDDIYVMGAIEGTVNGSFSLADEIDLFLSYLARESFKADFEVIAPVQSKIFAYVHKYRDALKCGPLPVSNIGPLDFMFVKEDPLGGGPFLPIKDDSEPSDEEEEGQDSESH
jgi:hypothetical protein